MTAPVGTIVEFDLFTIGLSGNLGGTWNHTVGEGDHRAILVFDFSFSTYAAPTCNGVAMTLLHQITYAGTWPTRIYGLLNPSVGTNTIVQAAAADGQSSYTASASWFGVGEFGVTAVGTPGSGMIYADVPTTIATSLGDAVVAIRHLNNTPYEADPGWVSRGPWVIGSPIEESWGTSSVTAAQGVMAINLVGYREPVVFPEQPTVSSYYDRFHFMIEDTHGRILARDVVPMEPSITRMLSGPCTISFKIHPDDPSIQAPNAVGPIQLKPYGHWVHALKYDLEGNEKIWASALVLPSDIDPQSGILTLKAEGFSNYPKGIPWLENWNPIAIDPFEIVERIWEHLQHGGAAGGDDFVNGDIGVTVTNKDGSTPADSGTQMLPGFSFDNEEFVQDFFAIFIRAVDRNDCGDYINKLARDIPFDYWEDTTWAGGAAPVQKWIRLAYPNGGVDQTDLIFRYGENVIAVVPKQETQVDWFSDVTMNGYFPGKVYSATLANADPDRYRRVMDEVDLHIDSNERAAAWAKRLLSRRQHPAMFESIIIDPYHPNAPHGSFDVGDIIRIQGPVPWVGDIDVKHKILAHTWDEAKGVVQLNVMADVAFNYDPIEYVEPD